MKMLCMTTPGLARTPNIAYFTRLWIDFGIDHLTRWKGSLTTGMNKQALPKLRKREKGYLAPLTTEGDRGSTTT
jgi:hypothetical protein